MTTDPLARVSTRRVPQIEADRPDEVKNLAGGHVFALDDLARVKRFLLLGTTGGSYYASERELTADATAPVLEMARTRTAELVDLAAAISIEGRAPRQQPALFALAAAAKLGDPAGRERAWSKLDAVARTGSTLATFVKYLEQFGGWGRATRRAVGAWYLDKTPAQLAYQLAKYRQRDGWAQRDVLRLAHPRTWRWELRDAGEVRDDGAPRLERVKVPTHPEHARLFEWVVRGGDATGLGAAEGLEKALAAATPAETAAVVREYHLAWEMLRSDHLNDRGVWEALLEAGVPLGALLRQLPRLTNLGLLAGLKNGSWAAHVEARLTDVAELRRARLHPLKVLLAARQYAAGRGERGSLTWAPERRVVDALDAAFYAAYGAVTPTGRNLLLALDVSGSMAWGSVGGLPLTPRELTAAVALVTANVEPSYELVGFTGGASRWGGGTAEALTKLAISPRQRLADATRYVAGLPMGPTDVARPMLYATKNRLEVDAFVVYTDGETWAGDVHPHRALEEYRQRSGRDAKLVYVAVTASRTSVADPADPRQLDVPGFDSSVPDAISEFVRG